MGIPAWHCDTVGFVRWGVGIGSSLLRIKLDEGISVRRCGFVGLIWWDEGMVLWLCGDHLVILGR